MPTLEISPRAEGSSDAGDDADPERLILVEPLPDLRNLPARGLVDGVELLRSVQRDLDDAFAGEGNAKVLVAEVPRFQRHWDRRSSV